MTLPPKKQAAVDWVEDNRANLSDWHREIWDMHEPAWRENRSAAWLCLLKTPSTAETLAFRTGTGYRPRHVRDRLSSPPFSCPSYLFHPA